MRLVRPSCTFLFLVLASTCFAGELSEYPAVSDSAKAKKERKNLPLEPGRNLEFSTTEASWMSVDVSPDGTTLVFDILGDLFTLPIAGGTATRIKGGMAYESQPRYSPDGKRIVFVSDSSGGNNIWLADANGENPEQLTKGNNSAYYSPEWTPDGNYIVVSKRPVRSGNAKPWLIHIEGGSGVQLVKEPANRKILGPAFNGDSRYIWWAQRTGDWQYNAIFPQYQVARYDRQTGKSTTMTGRYGSGIRPALSPDGKWLVYGTRHDFQTGLRIRDLATGEERWLAYPVQRDDQEARATMDALPGYSFTPDSKAIVASYGGKLWRVPVDGTTQQEIPFTANIAMELGPDVRFDYKIEDTETFSARQIRHAVPSPDGNRVVFTSLDRLYVADLPDGAPRRLTRAETGEYYPTWSPDGKWIAYVTWADNTGGHIVKMRADGRGRPTQLTQNAALYTETVWSPDGRRIVASRAAARDMKESIGFFGGGLGTEFVYVPAAGGAVTVIAPTEGRSAPHFTKDPNRIFVSGRDGLMSMRWDGTDEKAHVKVTGATLPGARQPMRAGTIIMAPEGDQAVATVTNHIYTVTVPYVGGDTPTVSVANPANAAFPAKKLTDIGGQFPAWGANGKKVYWSIGNALVTYDLDRAKAFADSLKAAAKADTADSDDAAADSSAVESDSTAVEDEKKEDKKKDKPKYKPVEHRFIVTGNRDIPSGVAALRGARVVTMKGYEVIENADIVIRNHRIEAVGARGQVNVPADAKVIDVSGKTITPGFVDTHYHAQWLIPNIHNTQVWQYLTNLAYGVTTTRDPQTATTDILSYSDRVESGGMIGPRIYSTGPGVFSAEPVKDLDHARSILKRYSDYYDTKTFKMYMSGNRQQRQWLIMAAKELELMPTTEGGLDYKLNLTHAVDGYSGLEHALPVFPLYKDVLELFVKSQITYSPTLLVSYGGPFAENYFYATERVYEDEKLRTFMPHKELSSKSLRRGNNPGPGGWFHPEEYVFDDHARFAADLIKAGGRVGVGSHGQLQGLGYHWELWATQSGGMSEHDALRAATIFGAEGIGFGNDIGSIEPGKLADLVIMEKNPLDDIRNSNTITHVMKNGRLYEGATLNETWPAQRTLPKQYWHGNGPAVQAGIR